MTVVLGTRDLKDKKQKRYNVTKCKHHDFEKESYANDIMMLKLSRPSKINPIPLPDKETKFEANTLCSVAGWGYVKSNGSSVDKLRAVNVSTIDQEVCQQKWKQEKKALPANIICAGGYETKKALVR
ncbi:hypothetical protein NHX12_032886 [Muraenolepis orangiensis]|uniref:Peptidase S1 domain-containing protein n=1 Tax=Muraenolepis orangiensis TaxID=630683 RepID=A0A9Q0E4H3_9TELE|nr:hypothetical protein NHX12_032886 [Muraenolepis orangiensis]